VGILEIMREQADQGVAADQVEDARRRLDVAIGHIRRGEPIPAEVGNGTQSGASALANMPEDARAYMRDVDATDPRALARAMTQPTLIVQGGNDTSVREHHGQALRDARGAGGEYLFVPGVTHMFKVVPPDVTRAEEFGYPGPTDPRVDAGIDRWIRTRVPERARS
jgi:pimeloyl-ACP methyl ester carboxylesterase